jgi:hypothetical protein
MYVHLLEDQHFPLFFRQRYTHGAVRLDLCHNEKTVFWLLKKFAVFAKYVLIPAFLLQ